MNVSRLQAGVIVLFVLVAGLSYVLSTGISDNLVLNMPNASFEGNYTGRSLRITHDGGDQVRSSELEILVENPEGSMADEEISGFGPGNVTRGDSATVSGLEGDETVELVWRDSTTDDSGTLFRWSGER
jgi:hypothetical protein